MLERKIIVLYELLKGKLDVFIGSFLFDSFAGYRLYKCGSLRWLKNKKTYKTNESIFFPKNNTLNYKEGFHVFSSGNHAKIQKLSSDFDKLLLKPALSTYVDPFGKPCDIKEACLLISKNVLSNFPNVLEFLDEKTIQILYKYYGSYFIPSYISIYRTKNIGAQTSSGPYAHNWHIDKHPSDNLKLFICLSDITKEHGPFQFLSRTDTKYAFSNDYKSCNNSSLNLLNEDKKNLFTGKSGKRCIIDTTTCLHRAGIPESSNERTLLTFTFKSSNEPFNPHSEKQKNQIKHSIDMINAGDTSYY